MCGFLSWKITVIFFLILTFIIWI